MANTRPLSVTKFLAGLGGALLIAAYFLPLLNTREPAARDAFGIHELRRQIDSTRDVDLVRPLLEPALHALERFALTPSLHHFSGVAGASTELLDRAASINLPNAATMRGIARALGWMRIGVWLLPLVGLVQLMIPALTRLRGHAGALGLVARFFFGLQILLLTTIPIFTVTREHSALLGPGIWTMFIGAGLMMIAGLFGVTRRNALPVLLIDAAIFGLTIFAIKTAIDAMN